MFSIKNLFAVSTSLFAVLTSLLAGDAGPSPPALEVSGVVISVIEQAEVPAQQRGPITSIAVQEGELVEQGQPLAASDDREALLGKQRAEIDRESAAAAAKNTIKIRLAKITLELAESELARGRRSRQLFEGAITDEEIQHRQLMVEQAKLQVEQAEYDLKQACDMLRARENELRIAEQNLERCRIAAPISGVVVEIKRRLGEWVEPGEAVLRIVRLDLLRAEGYLDAGRTPAKAQGQAVKLVVNLAQGERELAGVLKFMSPEINPVDGRVRVWAEVKNKDLVLRPGMRAAMRIELTHDSADQRRRTAAAAHEARP